MPSTVSAIIACAGGTPPGAARGLRVRMLGGFRLEAGGREVTIGLQKGRNLVKLLALAQGQRLHREQVIDELWPDLEPAAGLNNLHQAIFRTRAALAGPLGRRPLPFHGQVLSLDHEEAWVDVDAFEAAAAVARAAADPCLHERALAQYAGELLPDHRYDDWAVRRGEQLRGVYVELLVEAAELHEARGDGARAVALLERAIDVEPAWERAHAALMRLYAAAGQPQLVVRQYRRLAATLRDDLAAEPAPATEALYLDALAVRPARTRLVQPLQSEPAPLRLGLRWW